MIEEIIRKIIGEVVHLSLATVKDNKPWVCEVHFSYDDNLNLYFISRAQRRHSLEAEANKYVAGNIVPQHQAGEPVHGVYFEGEIERMSDVKETDLPCVTFKERFGSTPIALTEQTEDNGHQFYKISVSKFYLFDEIEMDPPGKHELVWYG